MSIAYLLAQLIRASGNADAVVAALVGYGSQFGLSAFFLEVLGHLFGG